MLLRYCLLLVIIIILNIEIDLIDGNQCWCNCRLNICHEIRSLKTKVDANTYDRENWRTHYASVIDFQSRWEQKMRSITEEEINTRIEHLEASKLNSRFIEVIINGSKAISSISTRNNEQEIEIFAMRSGLQAVEESSELLKSNLRKEQEARKKLEDDMKQMTVISRRNEEMKNQISEVLEKLRAVERRAEEIEADLRKEQNARKRLESDVIEKQNKEMKGKISAIESNLTAAEYRYMEFETELKKEKQERKEEDSKQIAMISTQNEELKSQISGVEAKFRATESRALKLGTDLQKEQVRRKIFEPKSRRPIFRRPKSRQRKSQQDRIPTRPKSQQADVIEKQNKEMKGKISAIESNLTAAEYRDMEYETELQKEKQERKESDSRQMSVIRRRSNDLEKKISNVAEKLSTAEAQALKLEMDMQTEKEAKTKQFQSNSNKISSLQVRNTEVENQISGLEGKLRTAENVAKRFENALKTDVGTKIKNNVNKLSTLEVRNNELRNRISGLEGKLRAAENVAKRIDTDLKREKEARTRLENDVVRRMSGAQRRNRPYNREARKLENLVDESEVKLHMLNNHTVVREKEMIKEHKKTKKIQKAVLDMYMYAVLAVTKILHASVPPKKFNNIIKELTETLNKSPADFDTWINDIHTQLPLSSRNATRYEYIQQRKANIQLNNEIKKLKESIRILNASVANISSSIAGLENKHKDEVISPGSHKEIDDTEQHQVILFKRPFDARRDP